MRDYDELPEAHRAVIDECIAEAWRNAEQNDALTAEDVAADIAQRLVTVYGVVTYPETGTAIDRSCPSCDARPGERCTQPTNTGRRPVTWYHLRREERK